MSDTPDSTEGVKRTLNVAMTDDRVNSAFKAVGIYGLGTVLVMMWYFQVYKPDQDARRELDRENGQTMKQLGSTTLMLVDQDRRREQATTEMLRTQSDQTRTMQEQTQILKQIMIDQRNGAWRDEPKKPGGQSVTSRPE